MAGRFRPTLVVVAASLLVLSSLLWIATQFWELGVSNWLSWALVASRGELCLSVCEPGDTGFDRTPFVWGRSPARVVGYWGVPDYPLPLFILVLGFGVMSAYAFVTRERTPRAGRCASCGYDLRGTVSSRCSECGHPVSDCTTPRRRPKRWRRRVIAAILPIGVVFLFVMGASVRVETGTDVCTACAMKRTYDGIWCGPCCLYRGNMTESATAFSELFGPWEDGRSSHRWSLAFAEITWETRYGLIRLEENTALAAITVDSPEWREFLSRAGERIPGLEGMIRKEILESTDRRKTEMFLMWLLRNG